MQETEFVILSMYRSLHICDEAHPILMMTIVHVGLSASSATVNLHSSLFGLFVLAMSNMAYEIGKLINLKLKM